MSIIPDICSMHILLVAATTFEIQPTIDFLGQGDRRTKTLITGVGSLPTVWSLMHQTHIDRPDLIIQAGIAGCFAGRQDPGKVVVIGEEILGDLGVWEDRHWKSLFDLKLADRDAPPFSNGRLVNPYKKLIRLTGLEAVAAMTVNEITTDPERIGWFQRQNEQPHPSVVVESMEGGGLHYVCLQEKIAFLQLRSISNEIGVRDKTKWDIKGAIDRLNGQLIALLEKLYTEDRSIIDL
ncbi:MAG TPA: futalosine hydrolase [Puia sp.]|jgi:futalosine hydrolase